VHRIDVGVAAVSEGNDPAALVRLQCNKQAPWGDARLRVRSGLDIAFVLSCPATALERIDHPVPRYLSI
jgi:hypothetical protein